MTKKSIFAEYHTDISGYYGYPGNTNQNVCRLQCKDENTVFVYFNDGSKHKWSWDEFSRKFIRVG